MQRFHILAAGNIVATSPLVLHWMCDSPRTGCAQRTPHVVRTSNIRVIMACNLWWY